MNHSDQPDLKRAKEEHEGLMGEVKTCGSCRWNQKCKWPHNDKERDCCVFDIYDSRFDPTDSCGRWEPRQSCGTCKYGTVPLRNMMFSWPNPAGKFMCARNASDNPVKGKLVPQDWGCNQWEEK